MTLDESIELWQKEHEHEIVYACNMDAEVHEIMDRANPWHTGTPTEEGWYLFRWHDDKERWFTIEYLTSEGIAKKDKWGSFDNCKWQKIEEEELDD